MNVHTHLCIQNHTDMIACTCIITLEYVYLGTEKLIMSQYLKLIFGR